MHAISVVLGMFMMHLSSINNQTYCKFLTLNVTLTIGDKSVLNVTSTVGDSRKSPRTGQCTYIHTHNKNQAYTQCMKKDIYAGFDLDETFVIARCIYNYNYNYREHYF